MTTHQKTKKELTLEVEKKDYQNFFLGLAENFEEIDEVKIVQDILGNKNKIIIEPRGGN